MVNLEINGYEVEYSGEFLDESKDWAAYLTLFLPSSNPMHMNNIFPRQRVLADLTFPDEGAAEDAAHKVALEMINSPISRIPSKIEKNELVLIFNLLPISQYELAFWPET